VVGAFLVGGAAVVVFTIALAGGSSPGQRWVVAARPLSVGTVLGPGDLASTTMRLSRPSAALSYQQAVAVEGRTLAVALPAGALIQGPELVPARAEPQLRPVSVAVDPVSMANLTPGQTVDVLATQGSGTAVSVVVVVRGATLMDVGSSGSGGLAGAAQSGQATIGVTTLGEVEAVVEASHAGTITLVAAEPSDGVGGGPGSARS
jgi:SAF domain